jgi:hypothetical protein
LIMALGLLIALAATLPAAAASSSRLELGGGAVVVGDTRRLSDLVEPSGSAADEAAARGLAKVALGAVTGLAPLTPASRPLALSAAVQPPPAPTLYSKALEVAGDYQLSRTTAVAGLLGSTLSERVQVPGEPAPAGGYRLSVPDLQLVPGEVGSSDLAELGGIRLSGRLSQLDDRDSRGYDLVASMPLASSKVGVSAHYRLVDVDLLAGEAALKPPSRQTMGVGGEVALTGGTVLKAGYEVRRDGGALTGTRADADLSLKLNSRTDVSAGVRLDRDLAVGPQVRTSLGVGYQLNGDAALRASYTLINFGAEAQAEQDRHLASAELSLRF